MASASRRNAHLLLPIAALVALAGCAGDRTGYPSLAPRAVERPDDVVEAAPTAAAVNDAALDARVAALRDQAKAADAAFARVANAACQAFSRPGASTQGSEAWISAQQSLSAVDAARAPVLAAAGELDRLVIERGTAEGAAIDLTKLGEAQAEVSALDAAEQARIVGLSTGKCAG